MQEPSAQTSASASSPTPSVETSRAKISRETIPADWVLASSPGHHELWPRLLPEHTTAASMLDRLLHHAVVVAPRASRFG